MFLKQLQALAQELEGIHSGSEDIEYIHRARVASRRVRSLFDLFDGCLPTRRKKKWLKGIKNITQALGEARDTDVQIERVKEFAQGVTEMRCLPGLSRLVLRLQQKRAAVQPAVLKAMEQLNENQLIDSISAHFEPLAAREEEVYLYTPALYAHAFDAVNTRLNDLLSYDEIVPQPEKKTELHAMRISAKQLRYTIESLAPLYAGGLNSHLQIVKKVQESLGDIHDCDVWIDFLPCFFVEERQRTLDYFGSIRAFNRIGPGILLFQQDRRQARDEMYAKFLRDWQRWKDNGVWQSLREETSVPFFKAAPEAPVLGEVGSEVAGSEAASPDAPDVPPEAATNAS